MATYLENLTSARDNLALELANETAARAAGGAKPTYSLDGEYYDWNGWLRVMTEKVAAFDGLIQRAQGPYCKRSRARA